MSSFVYDIWFNCNKSICMVYATDLNHQLEPARALSARSDPRGAIECARILRVHYNELGPGPEADIPVRIDPAPC